MQSAVWGLAGAGGFFFFLGVAAGGALRSLSGGSGPLALSAVECSSESPPRLDPQVDSVLLGTVEGLDCSWQQLL